MKLILKILNKLPIVIILVLVLGVLSTFMDFGIISVFFSITMPLIFIANAILALYGIFKKKYIYLIGVIVFFLFNSFFYQFSRTTNVETKDSISLLTYNVRSFSQVLYASKSNQSPFTEIEKFINSLSPDILVFQESSYKESKKIKDYPYRFIGYKENSEKSLLTIFSKYPIVNKGYVDFPNSKNDAIYADIKIQQDTIRVYNTHLQSYVISPYIIANRFSGFNYWENLNNTITKQVEQANLIKDHANKSNKKTIITGDFNATPYSLPYRKLKKGFNDSFITNGNGIGKTYAHRRYPLRLDYFLYDDQFKVLSHDNFNLKLSDHEPIFVKFKIKQL
ncbi:MULTISPECIES: endonuclease/exonuclease/phosphatase family protein [Winogradskyella]